MAAGSILLQGTGRRILDASGRVLLSNGVDDTACCCGEATPCANCPAPDSTPSAFLLTLAGWVPCGCDPNDSSYTRFWKIISGDINGTWTLHQTPGFPCAWGTTIPLVYARYSDDVCATLNLGPYSGCTVALSRNGPTNFRLTLTGSGGMNAIGTFMDATSPTCEVSGLQFFDNPTSYNCGSVSIFAVRTLYQGASGTIHLTSI
jgi:hypothetical protein